DGAAIEEETFLEGVGHQLRDRHRRVLPDPEEVDELEVDHLGAVLLGVFQGFGCCHDIPSGWLFSVRQKQKDARRRRTSPDPNIMSAALTGARSFLEGVFAALAGSNPDGLVDRGHEDLAVTDTASPRHGENRFHDVAYDVILHDDLDANFRD